MSFSKVIQLNIPVLNLALRSAGVEGFPLFGNFLTKPIEFVPQNSSEAPQPLDRPRGIRYPGGNPLDSPTKKNDTESFPRPSFSTSLPQPKEEKEDWWNSRKDRFQQAQDRINCFFDCFKM